MVQKPVKVDQETLDMLTERYSALKGEAEAVVLRVGIKNLVAEADAVKKGEGET